MNFSVEKYIPADFDKSSRVWIYQANRSFSDNEILEANELLHQFVASWKSHGADVKGYAGILFNHFVIVTADERFAGVGGCSTDSSVRAVKMIEQQFNIQLFDRQLLAFVVNGEIKLLPLNEMPESIEKGIIKADTLYFNNLSATKEELLSNWIIPAGNSWLAKRFEFTTAVSN